MSQGWYNSTACLLLPLGMYLQVSRERDVGAGGYRCHEQLVEGGEVLLGKNYFFHYLCFS